MSPAQSRNRVLASAAVIALAAGFFLFFRNAPAPEATQAPSQVTAERTRPQGPGTTTARKAAAGPQTSRVTVPAPEGPPSSGKLFFNASWGSGKEQLGKLDANESNPEAPMSLSVDQQGNLHVLDQVNGRISRFDKNGQLLPPIEVTQQVPRDLVVTPTGTTLVMDSLRDKTVAVLDADGRLLGDLPVTGKNLEEGGTAMGVFADSSGVYVERGDGMAVRVGDTTGTVDPDRPLLDGRPSRDGTSLLSMAVIQVQAGRFWVRSIDRATAQMKFMREYVLATPIRHLMFLDSDVTGRIYVAAYVARELPIDPATGESSWVDESVQLLCLGPMGEVQKVLSLPATTVPHESTRDLTLRDDGLIFYMHRTQDGVRILQYSCG